MARSSPLRVIARTGGVLLAQYAEAADLEPLLDRLDAAVLRPAQDAAPAHDGGRVDHEGGDAIARPTATTIYRRADVVDWCPVDDEQVAVLSAEAHGRGVLRALAGLAPAIWSAAADDIAVADLVRETIARFDDAPPADAVETAMVQLVEAGLLDVVSS